MYMNDRDEEVNRTMSAAKAALEDMIGDTGHEQVRYGLREEIIATSKRFVTEAKSPADVAAAERLYSLYIRVDKDIEAARHADALAKKARLEEVHRQIEKLRADGAALINQIKF